MAMNSRDKPGAIIKDVIKTNTSDTLMANSSHGAMRHTISRVRKTNDISVKEAVNLINLVIPDKYKEAYSGKLFLIDDSNDD